MKRINTLIVILTVLVVLFVANFLASRHPFRLDLTERRIYTLSNATRTLLKGLDDVVTIRVYFTQDLPPALQVLRRDVDDMLSEFKGAAGSRLAIEFTDPGASPMEEQKAQMIGIPPVQLNVVERDKQEVAKIYLGMAVMFGGRQQVLPVVKNVENLEYELAEAIVKVSSKELPKIAWWQQARPKSQEAGDDFDGIRDAISRRYTITEITDKELGDLDVKHFAALILISPGRLTDAELFAFDQYLMSGGRVMALVDRFDVSGSLNLSTIESNIFDLLENYGVTIEDSIVLDHSNAMAAFSGGPVTYHLPYSYWPQVRREQFNRRKPIVADLETLVLPWTSPVKLAPEKTDEIIAKTTQTSTAIPSKEARLDPQSANELLLRSQRESRPLAALLSGPFESYFANGKGVPPKGRNVIAEGATGARIFVTGSSRWVSDRILQTFPQNAVFFQNALDSFAMGDVLIGIRSREDTSRPIAILSDGVRIALKYTNIALGPLTVAVIGIVFLMIRRAHRRAVQMMYKI